MSKRAKGISKTPKRVDIVQAERVSEFDPKHESDHMAQNLRRIRSSPAVKNDTMRLESDRQKWLIKSQKIISDINKMKYNIYNMDPVLAYEIDELQVNLKDAIKRNCVLDMKQLCQHWDMDNKKIL